MTQRSVTPGAYVDDYFFYVFLRLISCTVIVFGWISHSSYLLELFSKRHRKLSYGVNSAISHALNVTLPVIAYFNR